MYFQQLQNQIRNMQTYKTVLDEMWPNRHAAPTKLEL